jgi:hypothetical protein
MTNRYRFDAENHVHLLDGRPLVGTSRVGNVLAKPLAWYGSGKAVEVFGCPNPKVLTKIKNRKATAEEKQAHEDAMKLALSVVKNMTVEEYSVMVDTAYRAHDTYMRQRAKGGTETHAECEAFIKSEMDKTDATIIPATAYDEKIRLFIEWSRENVKRWLWSEGHCYSEKYWIGGICDAGYEKLDGTLGILDFKSTKEAYVPQFWQCAGYDIQIKENGVLDKDGNLILDPSSVWAFSEYCIFAFGGDTPKPYFFSDPKGAKEAFLATLLIYNKLPQE